MNESSDIFHRSETARLLLQESRHVVNGKRKGSAESDGLDYSDESSKRSKNNKGSPDSPPLQGKYDLTFCVL